MCFVSTGHIATLQTPPHYTAINLSTLSCRIYITTSLCIFLNTEIQFEKMWSLKRSNKCTMWIMHICHETLYERCAIFDCLTQSTWDLCCCPDWTRKSTESPAPRMASTACSWLASRRSTPHTLVKIEKKNKLYELQLAKKLWYKGMFSADFKKIHLPIW